MNTGIIVAIVALLATIIGATIGAVTNYVLAERRERAERERDRLSHSIEVKRAARLIDMELARAESLAAIAIQKRYWVASVELSTEACQKYAGTVASDLSNSAWMALTLAFLAVEHIRGAKALFVSNDLNIITLSDINAEGIAPMLTDVTRVREALMEVAWGGKAFEHVNTELERRADSAEGNIEPLEASSLPNLTRSH
jgi:hypothetical protein